MKTSAISTLALCLFLSLPQASAATLSLEPASATVAPGAIVSLDLVISGLGDAAAPSLGDFDIDIAFDPGALSFTGYALGTMLGDVAALDALDASFGLFAPGGVNVAEVSFLSDGELVATQPDTFVIATLDFMLTGLGAGDSTMVAIAGVFALGDVTGVPIPVDALDGATITAIPVPGALWLMAAAVTALFGLRRTL